MQRSREEIIKLIEQNKIVAIMRKVPADAFEETVDALYKGGIRMMEVTFDQAGDMPMEETMRQIRFISEHYPDIAPGAGTVLTVEQVEKAREAGAQYIISPNVSEAVIKATVKNGMVSMPGAFTPSEAVNANLWGADFVKIFPVGKLGPGYVKDIVAPLSHIRFIAVGGINDKNLKEFLDAGCCGAGVAAALVDKKLIEEGNFEQLQEIARRHVAALGDTAASDNASPKTPSSYVTWDYKTLDRMCMDAFEKFGFTKDESRIISDVLLMSDLYGIESHGMQRMVRYHKGIEKGSIHPKEKCEVVFETPVSAVIEGHNGMGQLNGHYAMQLAIEKAKKSGVGIVSVRNSNHYGIAGYYAKMACDEGLIGVSCTNSEAIMVPTFGRQAMLGSNPIAVAMPADPYPFFFDCSTTVVTRGKLEMYNKMNKPLPDGWALNKDGKASNDAADVLKNIVGKNGGGIMPLGGDSEVSGSHKGYGYGMLCEILSSILSMGVTSNYCCTPEIEGGTGICHGFMAINPAFFGDANAIRKHLSTYLQELRESPKAEGQKRIYTHGEKEVEAMKDRMENGIPVNGNTMREIQEMCEYLQMDFSDYFGEYEPPVSDHMFSGNY